jgi:hypothetical protein
MSVYEYENNLLWESVEKVVLEKKNIEYIVPKKNKKWLMYDFYMIAYLQSIVDNDDSVGRRVGNPFEKTARMGLNDNIRYSFLDAKEKLVEYLKPHLLDAVFFSITCEARHGDRVGEKTVQDNLEDYDHKRLWGYYWKFYQEEKYGSGSDPSSHEVQILPRRPEPEKEERPPIRTGSDRYTQDQKREYIYSYKAAKRAIKKIGKATRRDFVEMAHDLFLMGGWGSSYGGKAWAEICSGWLKLYSSQNEAKDFVYIDHVYDLQHNSDTVFNKIKEYSDSQTGYRWIKDALDLKAEIHNPYEIIDKISPSMQRITRFILKSDGYEALESYDPIKHLEENVEKILNSGEEDAYDEAVQWIMDKYTYARLKNILKRNTDEYGRIPISRMNERDLAIGTAAAVVEHIQKKIKIEKDGPIGDESKFLKFVKLIKDHENIHIKCEGEVEFREAQEILYKFGYSWPALINGTTYFPEGADEDSTVYLNLNDDILYWGFGVDDSEKDTIYSFEFLKKYYEQYNVEVGNIPYESDYSLKKTISGPRFIHKPSGNAVNLWVSAKNEEEWKKLQEIAYKLGKKWSFSDPKFFDKDGIFYPSITMGDDYENVGSIKFDPNGQPLEWDAPDTKHFYQITLEEFKNLLKEEGENIDVDDEKESSIGDYGYWEQYPNYGYPATELPDAKKIFSDDTAIINIMDEHQFNLIQYFLLSNKYKWQGTGKKLWFPTFGVDGNNAIRILGNSISHTDKYSLSDDIEKITAEDFIEKYLKNKDDKPTNSIDKKWEDYPEDDKVVKQLKDAKILFSNDVEITNFKDEHQFRMVQYYLLSNDYSWTATGKTMWTPKELTVDSTISIINTFYLSYNKYAKKDIEKITAEDFIEKYLKNNDNKTTDTPTNWDKYKEYLNHSVPVLDNPEDFEDGILIVNIPNSDVHCKIQYFLLSNGYEWYSSGNILISDRFDHNPNIYFGRVYSGDKKITVDADSNTPKMDYKDFLKKYLLSKDEGKDNQSTNNKSINKKWEDYPEDDEVVKQLPDAKRLFSDDITITNFKDKNQFHMIQYYLLSNKYRWTGTGKEMWTPSYSVTNSVLFLKNKSYISIGHKSDLGTIKKITADEFVEKYMTNEQETQDKANSLTEYLGSIAVEVYSNEESRKVQKELIKLGYSWTSGVNVEDDGTLQLFNNGDGGSILNEPPDWIRVNNDHNQIMRTIGSTGYETFPHDEFPSIKPITSEEFFKNIKSFDSEKDTDLESETTDIYEDLNYVAIKVLDEEESKKVQSELVKLGYLWNISLEDKTYFDLLSYPDFIMPTRYKKIYRWAGSDYSGDKWIISVDAFMNMINSKNPDQEENTSSYSKSELKENIINDIYMGKENIHVIGDSDYNKLKQSLVEKYSLNDVLKAFPQLAYWKPNNPDYEDNVLLDRGFDELIRAYYHDDYAKHYPELDYKEIYQTLVEFVKENIKISAIKWVREHLNRPMLEKHFPKYRLEHSEFGSALHTIVDKTIMEYYISLYSAKKFVEWFFENYSVLNTAGSPPNDDLINRIDSKLYPIDFNTPSGIFEFGKKIVENTKSVKDAYEVASYYVNGNMYNNNAKRLQAECKAMLMHDDTLSKKQIDTLEFIKNMNIIPSIRNKSFLNKFSANKLARALIDFSVVSMNRDSDDERGML